MSSREDTPNASPLRKKRSQRFTLFPFHYGQFCCQPTKFHPNTRFTKKRVSSNNREHLPSSFSSSYKQVITKLTTHGTVQMKIKKKSKAIDKNVNRCDRDMITMTLPLTAARHAVQIFVISHPPPM